VSSPNFTIGKLSIIFTYFAKIGSNTAGNVVSTSNIRTGTPFFIDDFIYCWNDEFESFVITFFSFDGMFVSHFVA